MARSNRRPGEPELSEGMRLLDRYTVLDRIGSGGMATIYRASDERLDRVVCIKLLRTTLVEGSGSNTSGRAVYQATYAHFLKEALALSKLQHPHTLRIYDFGYYHASGESGPTTQQGASASGSPFHVCEYLDGGNLETHVRLRGALPDEEVLAILEPISEALAEAHEHGIIHRDIKPSNILFARVRGELVPKLADFGISHSNLRKAGGEAEPLSTVALFSPRWAAPEQLCGSPEGPRTDVYALALVTLYMLQGMVLFGDDDVRTTFNDRVRSDELVRGRLDQLHLDPGVRAVLAEALLARPDDRIASPPELVERLRGALAARAVRGGEAIPLPGALPPPAEERAPQPASSGPELALEVDVPGAAQPVPAPERIVHQGGRRIRQVQVHEKLDLSFLDAQGAPVRVRLTLLPGSPINLHVKGMTCFVARQGGRATPAVTITQDASVDLLSSARQPLGALTLYFGTPTPNGRLFVVDGQQLLIPYSEAQQAVALTMSSGHDLLVMCRR